MPVIAVGFAVALDVGAVAAATAGTLTTLAAITAIGATVGAVGAVTHNKTLSLIGAGIGIVGAIGTLASGAGIFDNVSSLFNASPAAGAGASGLADTGSLWTGTVADLPGAAASGAAESLADTGTLWTGTTAELPGAINATAALAPAEGNAAALLSGGQGGAPLSGALSEGASAAGAVPNIAAEANAAVPAGASAYNTEYIEKGLSAMSSSATPPSGLMAWANKNPLLAFGAIQAGGSFISGLTNPMTPAQIDALNSQAEVNRQTAELLKRQMNNQGAAIPSAVTGKPALSAGLINSKTVGTPLITGAPNAGTQPTPVTGTPA
jgi:hypothetical protein